MCGAPPSSCNTTDRLPPVCPMVPCLLWRRWTNGLAWLINIPRSADVTCTLKHRCCESAVANSTAAFHCSSHCTVVRAPLWPLHPPCQLLSDTPPCSHRSLQWPRFEVSSPGAYFSCFEVSSAILPSCSQPFLLAGRHRSNLQPPLSL